MRYQPSQTDCPKCAEKDAPAKGCTLYSSAQKISYAHPHDDGETEYYHCYQCGWETPSAEWNHKEE